MVSVMLIVIVHLVKCIDGRCQSISVVWIQIVLQVLYVIMEMCRRKSINKATEIKSTVIDSNLLFDSSSISATTSAGQVSVVRVVDCVSN